MGMFPKGMAAVIESKCNFCSKKSVKKFWEGNKSMKQMFQILAELAFGSSILVWAVQYAYACRGYQAIGGEYILAGLAAIFIYWLIGKV